MDRLGWIALVLVACGPSVPTDSASASAESSGSEGSSDSIEPDTSADPTTISTSTTADPTVPSTVTTVDPDASATMLPETDGMTDCLGGGGPLALGEGCVASSDCASGVCRSYGDAPPDAAAYCDAAPDDCSTVITATVWRLPPAPAGEPGVPVKVVAALEAITNPAGATPLFAGESDAAGRIDGATDGPVTAAIAIVAIAGGDATYYATALAVAPEISMGMYDVGTDVHDFWVVSTQSITAFNTALTADPTVPGDLLPLGDAGGVVGIVRDAAGDPIAGAVVESTVGGSQALIRYVTDDGDVDSVATHQSGVFIILDPTPTGEEFSATVDGSLVATGIGGTASGVVFALPLTGV